MRRVFKTPHFSRWMRKTELTDSALCSAVAEIATGLIDADLGGGEVEAVQRIAADLLGLGSSELDTHVASEALKEICHGS